MVPLSAYSVSEPLGALETVKRDLLFQELLFGTKQLKQKSRQNCESILQNQHFSFRFEIIEDYKKKTKKENLRGSTCCSKVRDLSPHTSWQGNPGLIPIEEEKHKLIWESTKIKCIRLKISKIKLMACQGQGLNTQIYILYVKTMKSQDFRTFKQENLICAIYMKSRLQKSGFQ